MKYTAEEVRAIAKRLHDDITVADGDALMASDMLTAYAARIEADDAAVATFSRSDVSKWRDDAFENAAQIVDRYAKHFPEVTGAADDIRALITRPPAQAAQVDESRYTAIGRAFCEVLADPSVAWRDTESKTFIDRVCQTTSRIESAPTAEPATHGEVDWIAALRKELLHSKMTHNFTFTRDEVMQLIGDPFSQPAQSVDVAKVREVIAEIRRCAGNNNAKFHLTWADKLEAAIKGGA